MLPKPGVQGHCICTQRYGRELWHQGGQRGCDGGHCSMEASSILVASSYVCVPGGTATHTHTLQTPSGAFNSASSVRTDQGFGTHLCGAERGQPPLPFSMLGTHTLNTLHGVCVWYTCMFCVCLRRVPV